MIDHKIGRREEWLAARERLLECEKEHTRLGDELARRRRELPWVRVEKDHVFDTDEGTRTLRELFDGRSQLLVYHFMFGPSYEARLPNQLVDRRRAEWEDEPLIVCFPRGHTSTPNVGERGDGRCRSI